MEGLAKEIRKGAFHNLHNTHTHRLYVEHISEDQM